MLQDLLDNLGFTATDTVDKMLFWLYKKLDAIQGGEVRYTARQEIEVLNAIEVLEKHLESRY